MIIAVTGTFGSGKSCVSRMLASALPASYLDTDQLCREELQKGRQGYQDFVEGFGSDYLLVDGTIDRAKLREAVFGSASLRSRLEAILHPLVRATVLNASTERDRDCSNLVVEVPLLFESGWQDDFDVVIAVFATNDLSAGRVFSRDGLTPNHISLVQASQLSPQEKMAMADIVIHNSSTLTSCMLQVRKLARELQECGCAKSGLKGAKMLDSCTTNTYKKTTN